MSEYVTLKAKDEDVKNIAILHLKAFSRDHFTSRFPIDLLEEYFACLIRLNEHCYVMYTLYRNKIQGYIVAGSYTGKAIDEFMRKNMLNVFFVLIKNPGFLIEKSADNLLVISLHELAKLV